MRRLRPTDGTQPHLRAARYHMAKCQKPGPALHAELRAEMTARYEQLQTKSRLVEDAEASAIDAGAAADEAEIALEDLLRDIDADLAKVDRSNPSLNARTTVFPDGYGAAIDPEAGEQLKVLAPLRVRLSAFAPHSDAVAAGIQKLDAAEVALKNALAAESEADAKVQSLFAEETQARREVREQLESAFGRLRDLYKARPAVVERFFLREIGGRRRAEAPAATPPAAGPPPAAGAGGEAKPA